jgi:hypothetical protein
MSRRNRSKPPHDRTPLNPNQPNNNRNTSSSSVSAPQQAHYPAQYATSTHSSIASAPQQGYYQPQQGYSSSSNVSAPQQAQYAVPPQGYSSAVSDPRQSQRPPPGSTPHQGYNVQYSSQPNAYSQPQMRPPPITRKKTIKNIQLTPQGMIQLSIHGIREPRDRYTSARKSSSCWKV